MTDAPDPDQEWKLQWRRGSALTSLGRQAEALNAYRAGAAAADNLRKAPLGYRLDSTFLRDKLPMFHAAIDLAVQLGDGPTAVRLIELIKARGLAATLSLPRASGMATSEEEARFDEISARIDGIDFECYRGSADTATLRRRSELLAERDALLERLRIRDPRWRTMTQPTPVDVESLVTRLAAGRRCALTLLYRPGHVVAALLDDNGVAVGIRTLESDVERELRSYADNVRIARDPYGYDFSGETGESIASLVPDDIAARTLAAPILIVIPHGILHLLPWAAGGGGGALRDSNARRAPHAWRRHKFRVLGSCQSRRCRRGDSSRRLPWHS